MQAKDISRFTEERKDKEMQRAVLGLALHNFPAQMTRGDLDRRGFRESERLEQALHNLSLVGLIWREGDFAIPTLPARHFHWMEWS